MNLHAKRMKSDTTVYVLYDCIHAQVQIGHTAETKPVHGSSGPEACRGCVCVKAQRFGTSLGVMKMFCNCDDGLTTQHIKNHGIVDFQWEDCKDVNSLRASVDSRACSDPSSAIQDCDCGQVLNSLSPSRAVP